MYVHIHTYVFIHIFDIRTSGKAHTSIRPVVCFAMSPNHGPLESKVLLQFPPNFSWAVPTNAQKINKSKKGDLNPDLQLDNFWMTKYLPLPCQMMPSYLQGPTPWVRVGYAAALFIVGNNIARWLWNDMDDDIMWYRKRLGNSSRHGGPSIFNYPYLWSGCFPPS